MSLVSIFWFFIFICGFVLFFRELKSKSLSPTFHVSNFAPFKSKRYVSASFTSEKSAFQWRLRVPQWIPLVRDLVPGSIVRVINVILAQWLQCYLLGGKSVHHIYVITSTLFLLPTVPSTIFLTFAIHPAWTLPFGLSLLRDPFCCDCRKHDWPWAPLRHLISITFG